MPQVAAAPSRRVDLMAARRPSAPAVLVVMLLVAGLLVLYAGRHLTFFFDEWDFILQRRGSGLDVYLDAHNGHLVLFPVVMYKLLFAIVGLHHYTPYRAVAVVLHLLCGALLYCLVRRRLGSWLALAPTALLLFMGSAFEDLLWPFQIGLFVSVAGGLGALLCLEREDGLGDVAAAALLVWSLTGSAVGVPFLVAGAVMLIGQRGPWPRLWVVVAPAALFGLWYLGWGANEHVTSDAVLGAPQYAADAASAATAGIAGLTITWGPPLAIAALAAIFIGIRRQGGMPSPLLLGAAVGLLAFWLLAAGARADAAEPTASRYVYVGATFIFLIVSEAWTGIAPRGGWAALMAVLIAGALVGNIDSLRAGARAYGRVAASVRASLAVVELAAPVVTPTFVPEPTNAPQITAGPYLAAVHDLGSPALTLSQLEHAPASIRANSDLVLIQAERLALMPVAGAITGASRPVVEASSGGRITAVGRCERLLPTTGAATLGLRVAPGGAVLIHANPGRPVAIYLRRLATTFQAPFAFVSGGTARTIRFPVDRAGGLPWHVRLSAAQATEVCVR